MGSKWIGEGISILAGKHQKWAQKGSMYNGHKRVVFKKNEAESKILHSVKKQRFVWSMCWYMETQSAHQCGRSSAALPTTGGILGDQTRRRPHKPIHAEVSLIVTIVIH
jgi:hypothetical protein